LTLPALDNNLTFCCRLAQSQTIVKDRIGNKKFARRQPSGARRRSGICVVAAPRRCPHIACVAAPCICPPGARAKMWAGCRRRGITVAEAMRMVAGADLALVGPAAVEPEWAGTVAGHWLAEILGALRAPEALDRINPERDLKGPSRSHQQVGSACCRSSDSVLASPTTWVFRPKCAKISIPRCCLSIESKIR